MKFVKLLRTPIFTESFRWLLLIFCEICTFLEECFLWVATSEIIANISCKCFMKMCWYVLLTCCLLMFYVLFKRTQQFWRNLFLFTNSSIFLFFLTSFKMLVSNPLYYKKKPCMKIFDFFLLWLYNRFFFVWEVLYERSCSTKGAAQLLTTLLCKTAFLKCKEIHFFSKTAKSTLEMWKLN